MDSSKEKWRPVVGWESTHSVSSHGNVRRESRPLGWGKRMLKQRLIVGSRDRGGYRWIVLVANPKREFALVHRLVANAFLGDITGLQINHKDGKRDNNRPENLEIVTASQNVRHKMDVLHSGIGDTNGKARLAEANIWPLKRLHSHGVSLGVLADSFRVNEDTIIGAVSERCWGHVKEAG